MCGKDFEYLGFRFSQVSDTLAMMAPEGKLEILKNIPVPKNVRELQSFIGFCSFFSCLILNGKALMAPLIGMIRKDCTYKWGEQEQWCFEQIKECLSAAMLKGFLNTALHF